MAFGEIANHVLGPAAGNPALYAVVAMGAVFASAARAPLTSVASVVEMTGDYTLTLPVMLAVAVATAVSRGLSYGTIYTTKLLRRGQDIERSAPWRAFGDLTAADAMRPFPEPLTVPAGPRGHGGSTGNGRPPPAATGLLPGTVTYRRDPQAVFATESLAQVLRQLRVYGRDGLPVISDDGEHVEGWITNASVLQAVTRELGGSPARAAWAATAASRPGGPTAPARPPTPLQGYEILEVSVAEDSPACGKALSTITWPAVSIPVAVLRRRSLQEPEPGMTLAAGDRVSLLAPAPAPPASGQPSGGAGDQHDGRAGAAPQAEDPASAPGEQA
jgi:chloride channel protein, CIC family